MPRDAAEGDNTASLRRATSRLPRVEVVLVRPETPANVGATARVIANMGLAGLSLVDPGDYRTVDCFRTAWGAQDILESSKVFPSLREALAESHYAIALSGRTEGGARDVREMAQDVHRLAPGQTANLVFGPETSGLTLDEIALCGRVASIPSHPAQPSLNLSHAVMVVAYEIYRARPERSRLATERATHSEKSRLFDLLSQGLRAIHALGDHEHYRREWEGILLGMELSPRQVRLLGHAARKMIRAAR